MDCQDFIRQVADEAELPYESGEHETKAIIGVLLDHLSSEDGARLLDYMPVGLAEAVQSNKEPSPMTAPEFLDRVVASSEADEFSAERAARAVFATLPKAVGQEEYQRVERELDPTLRELTA